MQALGFVRQGFQTALRHKRLILVLWFAPLIPAIILGTMAASNLVPALGRSFFSDRVLTGDWWVVLREFRGSPADDLGPILGLGVITMLVFSWLIQVGLSSGVVEVMLERRRERPFVLGVRKNFLPFLRASILLVTTTLVALFAARLVMRGMFKVAEAQADGRWDVAGIVLAAIVFFLLWAPLDLAADLSRIAAARHDQRSMVRGFFRALGQVLRRPGLLIPLYLVFLALPLILQFLYYQLRSPWSAATVVTILLSLLLQQGVMIIRAFFKLGFWGAEVAAFRGFDEPEFCRPKVKRTNVEPVMSGAAELTEAPPA